MTGAPLQPASPRPLSANVLGIVLAGGEGKRLWPLTADRAKPAVPFGGNYRLIDFVLSNLVNAGVHRICVLTQYKSHSLDRHISTTWRLSSVLGQYITPVPAQQRLGPRWYTGSADAIFQSLNLVYDERPDYIAVFGADHVYRMDPAQMIAQHIETGAGVTVAGIRVPRAEAKAFGFIDADEPGGSPSSWRSRPTRRRCRTTRRSPSPRWATTSSPPRRCSRRCAPTPRTATPSTTWAATSSRGWSAPGDASVYDFADNDVPGATERDPGYWRDVGTIDAYYEAHMDLVSVHPIFNLYNERWPIRTASAPLPPAKFVEGGIAQDSIVGAGTIISGAIVRRSVISPNVRDPGRGRGVGLGGDARGAGRARGDGARRDPGQERGGPGRRARRGGPGHRPGPLHGEPGRRGRARQGRHRAC